MKNNFNHQYSYLKNDLDNNFLSKPIFNQKRSLRTNNSYNLNHEQNFFPRFHLDQYQIRNQQFNEIKKKPIEPIKYIQQIGIRYLEPPEAAKPGDLVIRQLPDKQIDPEPPIIIRKTPPKPVTPPPLIIREQPPIPLKKIEKEIIEIPGKILRPPPRQIIIEKLPTIPPKPPNIIIDKWLPQRQPKRQVIYEKIPNSIPLNQNPKNVLINWESPNIQIERRITNLGTYKVDPKEYTEKYASNFSPSEVIDDILQSVKIPNKHIHYKSHMTKSSKSYYQNDSTFSNSSFDTLSQITNKKRVRFQGLN